MLDATSLKDKFSSALESNLKEAFKTAIDSAIKYKTTNSDQTTTQMAHEFTEVMKDSMAAAFANAVSTFVQGIEINGTIESVVHGATATAQIHALATPILNGTIPNTLGVTQGVTWA